MFYSISKEPIIIERKFVRKDEQIKLIIECRQSGLSDYQWCRQRDINPSTFYNWVSKLRKSGYTFPDSQSKSVGTAVVQEVVKLDVAEQEVSSPVIGQNACSLPLFAVRNDGFYLRLILMVYRLQNNMPRLLLIIPASNNPFTISTTS